MHPVAAWMPLSHTVPDARVRIPSDRARHEPAGGLVVTENDGDRLGPGVCLYLGPPSRTYRRRQEPAIAYVMRADSVAADAPAFPCDLGGSGLSADDVERGVGTHADARAWRDTLFAATGEWTACLDWDFAPPREALPDVIRTIAVAGDPGSWTPEVRSRLALGIATESVHVAAITSGVTADATDAGLALVTGLRQTREQLAVAGVDMIAVHPRLTERPARALHRVVATWLRAHAPRSGE